MRGHIKKRSKDSWSIVVDMGPDPETGKRRQQWVTVRGSKRDAEARLNDIFHSKATGTYVKPHRMTVAVFLKEWLRDHAHLNCTPRTAERYESIVNTHLIPALGYIRLISLEPRDIQNHYTEALTNGRADGTGGLSPTTVVQHHRILHKAFNHAVRQGLLIRNPADQVDPPRAKNKRMTVLSPNEVTRMLESSRDSQFGILYRTAVGTGMRRGELFGLQWGQVDLDLGYIYVLHSLDYLASQGTYLLKEPKTSYGKRQIALSPSLSISLREHRQREIESKALLGTTLKDSDFVFARHDGLPLVPSTVTVKFKQMLLTAGLPEIRFHDLRHTHATLMLLAGVHPKIVSERLGHASIVITLDLYSHVIPGMQEAAAEKFDRYLAPKLDRTGDVSKMLATSPDTDREPGGFRTHDTRIKSPVLYH